VACYSEIKTEIYKIDSSNKIKIREIEFSVKNGNNGEQFVKQKTYTAK